MADTKYKGTEKMLTNARCNDGPFLQKLSGSWIRIARGTRKISMEKNCNVDLLSHRQRSKLGKFQEWC